MLQSGPLNAGVSQANPICQQRTHQAGKKLQPFAQAYMGKQVHTAGLLYLEAVICKHAMERDMQQTAHQL